VTVNLSKILTRLSSIEEEAAEIRQLLFCPDGIRIVGLNRDDLSFVEYWDGENDPRILFCLPNKAEDSFVDFQIKEAIGLIPPSYCDNKKVEIHTDLELSDFSEGTLVGIKIFDIELKYPSEDLTKHIRGRHDFNNYMSRLKDIQKSTQ